MERKITKKLIEWEKSANRKPLIIEDARQVGKKWILENALGKLYDNVIKLNFGKDDFLKKIFDNDYDTNRIIFEIETYFNTKIIKNNTLLIFDEIQEAPRALTSLKYFNEDNNDYHIACAGSLLGIKLSKTGFPVGKVNTINMYPMDFEEFLMVLKEDNYLNLLNALKLDLINKFASKFIELLKLYYIIGGMPEVVYNFSINKNISMANAIQDEILSNYKTDINKHSTDD
ncbi:MAG: AAA family ATPase [Bacilli bacterium]|nr:AAA family ATPase [Bacilli bacterium]